MKNLHPKIRGTIIEYQVATALMQLGCNVSFPLGECSPYDLIFEFNKKLYRVQVKHAVKENGKFYIYCQKQQGNLNTKLISVSYELDDFEFFGTYLDGICYLIDNDKKRTVRSFRLNLPKNLQIRNIDYAVEYEAEYVLKKLENLNVQPRIDMHKLLETKKEENRLNSLKALDASNSQYGTIWITNGDVNKKINKNDKIPEGFRRGRTYNWMKK